ncbi:MAG: response regulator [Blautia sp.]|nr:response regulator [Blautia sp.]
MKMKNLQKLAGITILLILFFMVIALLRFQEEEKYSLIPEQIEYYYNEDWFMVSLESKDIAYMEPGGPDKILTQLENALAEGNYRKTDLPYTYTGKDGAAVITAFQNTLPPDCAGLTMGFSSTAANVRVILDGRVIYQYKFSEGDGIGAYEHFIDIPNVFEQGDIWIELSPLHAAMAPSLGNVVVETRDIAVIGLVGNSIADIGCCLLIIIMSIIMFVLALIRKHTNQPSRGEFFWGLAGLSAGIYCFIGTNTLSIFYDIQEAYAMQEYLVLLIPLFLTLYFDRNLHAVFPRRFTILHWLASINAAMQILLQMLHIRALKDMTNISALMLGLVCVTAIVSLLQFDYQNKRYRTLLSVASLTVLLAGGITNVIINMIHKGGHNNTAGQYSMVIFGILIATVHVLQLSKEYRANAEENARLLKEKIKEALAANEAKGKFLAHMSHEIRTPINAVLGMDEMILREAKDPSVREYAMDIHTAGQTLLSLINDILDFSKIESGKMEIVPVEYDISSLIHDLANMTAQRAQAKNIRLEVKADREIPSRLYGDDVRLRQVLTNILTNAVKYTHEGTIWLRIQGRTEEDTAILHFEVEDTGIGIREEDLPKLFAEFERIEEERNRHIEGTGLGMNITIQLLALLGSRLQVESTYGKGSKFYFELEQKIIDATPIGDFEIRAQQIAENYNYSAGLFAPDAKILVTDDNAVNRKVFRNLLKETQIQVTEAAGGRECLELVQENHYDLIFLDHMMPEMDGLETLHRIKLLSDFPCRNTPIVVLTANAVSGAKEKYLAEGFDDFLSKPIVPEKLENMIRNMLPDELQTEKLSSEEPKDEFPDDLPPVDGLDWNYAWMHLPDTELLAYTLKEFYAQIDSAADTLEQSYTHITEPGQLAQYRIQVHAMKSLAATVGILPLSGVAKLLEYAARDGKMEVINSLTALFLEEWRGYRQKLYGVFGLGAETRKEAADYSIIKALVEIVRVSMQELDVDQADQAIEQLQTYEYPTETEQNIRRLAEAVTNLDPDAADEIACLLMKQMEGK